MEGIEQAPPTAMDQQLTMEQLWAMYQQAMQEIENLKHQVCAQINMANHNTNKVEDNNADASTQPQSQRNLQLDGTANSSKKNVPPPIEVSGVKDFNRFKTMNHDYGKSRTPNDI